MGKSTGPGRTAVRTSAAARPLGTKPQRVPTSTATGARRVLEERSAGALVKIARLHKGVKILAAIGLLAMLLGGLLLPSSFAGLLLVAVGLFVGWLLALSWPALDPAARVVRLAVVLVIFVAAIWRLSGNG